MKLYPICLKLENTACCVVGGGDVALRKVKSLLEAGAQVTVISPKLCKRLQLMHRKKLFNYKNSKYQKKFLEGKILVIAATNNNKVNKKIADDGFLLNLLVNVVDSPEECNFYIPSLLRKKELLMTISTQGLFPGLAKKIKEECSPILDKYAKNIQTLAGFRQKIKQRFKKEQKIKKLLLKNLMQPAILKMIEDKDIRNLDDLKTHLKVL